MNEFANLSPLLKHSDTLSTKSVLEFPQDIEQFLETYWQQKPCLIRKAFPEWVNLLSPEELAGLACEPEFESRLVSYETAAPHWQTRHGPFTEADFLALPEDDWTLLVQDVDKHIPEVAALLEHFRFVPDWRLDDVMISYAATNGTVGPHWDDYDVFLIQGYGTRRWSTDSRPMDPGNTVDGIDLRIMKTFAAEQEWVLEPGDMLYLPPKLAHHGVALEPCMTYSVGFRAPEGAALASYLFDHWLEENPREDQRFGDAGRRSIDDPFTIEAPDLAALQQLAGIWLNPDPDWVKTKLLAFLTEPKPGLDPVPADTTPTLEALRGTLLLRNSGSRALSHHHSDDKLLMAIGGIVHTLSLDESPITALLSSLDSIEADELIRLARSDETRHFLIDLVAKGHLEILDE